MTTATGRTPPAPRDRLVRAGLEELDDLPLHRVFAGATAAAVAARAGVTTGSFFHHFNNAAEFADALALSYAAVPEDVGEAIEEIVDSLHHVDLLDIMQSSLTDTWQIFLADELVQLRFRGQMQLWAHHDQPLHEPTDRFGSVADILRQSYRARQDEASAIWALILERSGRKILPPFTLDRLATALTSLFQGLVLRQAVDADAVDDEMFADVVTALAAALTVPMGSRIRLSDLTRPLRDDSNLSPQARSGARRRRETRIRISEASGGLFDRGWESVSSTEVAERAGVSPQTVINLFPSVRSIAATHFTRHTIDIRRVAQGVDATHADADPLERLRATLVRLAESVTEDPEPARALLSERLAVTLQRGGDFAEWDVRLEVPLADSILHPLAELDIGDAEPIDLARTLIDFVLAHAIGRPNREADTAELALRLLPDSARARTRSGPE